MTFITDEHLKSDSTTVDLTAVGITALTLKERRQRSQLSQAKLAAMTGIPRVYLSQFECGRYQLTSVEEESVLAALAMHDGSATLPIVDSAALEDSNEQTISNEIRLRELLAQPIPRFLFLRDDEALQERLVEIGMLAVVALDQSATRPEPLLNAQAKNTVGYYLLSQYGDLSMT